MSLEEKKLLTDIQTCIGDIDIHLGGKRDFNVYLQNNTIIWKIVNIDIPVLDREVGELLAQVD